MEEDNTVIEFVQLLKYSEIREYINGKGKERQKVMVVSSDVDRLYDICLPSSRNHNKALCNYDKMLHTLFKQDEIWINRGFLKRGIAVITFLQD